MAQIGFFDLSTCYERLDAGGDILAKLDAVVPWEEFRPTLERVWRKPNVDRKSNAGRKPMDVIVMFKTLVLGALFNLSDEQVEHQANDRLTFKRFLGLDLADRVPDAKTIWLYREGLTKAGKVEELFNQFDGYLERRGYAARGGQMLDASFALVPRNHNTREENKAIKKGELPGSWDKKSSKTSQKDRDARWTKKNGISYYGYKNHVNVDGKHKLIRRYCVTNAARGDIKVVNRLLTRNNCASGVWADSAYRSEDMEEKLKDMKLKSHIHHKGQRNKPLNKGRKAANRTKSKVRARVEHVFGAQSNDMGGTLVRTIGITRAKTKIGMKNLVYNMRRYVHLLRVVRPRRRNLCPA